MTSEQCKTISSWQYIVCVKNPGLIRSAIFLTVIGVERKQKYGNKAYLLDNQSRNNNFLFYILRLNFKEVLNIINFIIYKQAWLS